MRKLLAFLLACLLLCGSCLAEEPNYTDMTDDQLHAIIDAARNELYRRQAAPLEILLEQDGVQVYLTGKREVWGDESCYLDLEAVLVNNSEVPVYLSFHNASINGWEVSASGLDETSPGKKRKGNLSFCLSDADIATYEEIEELSMTLYLFNGTTWETIATAPSVTMYPNK